MTQEERIIKKVYDAKKVELGTHKVDLGLAEDVDKESESMTNYLVQLNKIITDYNNKGKEMKSLADKIAKESVSSLKVMSNYESKVKELGFDLPMKFNIQKKSVENLQKMTDKLRMKPLEISTNPGSY